ncbi:MAG: hypothetical protein QM667_08785 [Asticcacaulis sp.]
MIRPLAAAFLLLTVPVVMPAQAQTPPLAGPQAYAPFVPLIGKSWRGTSIKGDGAEDIQRWEWAIGGHAVRVIHSVNGGAYAGETLIFRDKEKGYIYHYFTTAGFHTTGVMTPTGPGTFTSEETVHGLSGFGDIRSTLTLDAAGVWRTRASVQKNGAWVEMGGFDYREDPAAVPILPKVGQ